MNQSNLTTKQKRLLDIEWIFAFIIVAAILRFCPKERELGLIAKYDPVPVTVVEKTDVEEIEEVEIKSEQQEIEDSMLEISYLKSVNKQEYLYEYKNILSEHKEYYNSIKKTLQDFFTDDEIILLYQVVEAEATEGNFINKANVASVVFNRWYSDRFPEKLSDILDKKQFSCIKDGRYKEVKITQDTIDACEYAFMIEDTTKAQIENSWLGCIYFEKGSKIHDAYSTYVFTDSIGHKFYY